MSDAERYGPQLDDLHEEELRGLRNEGRKKPKPTGHVCRSCVPQMYPGPSGVRLRHAFDCDDKPGQPIDVRDYAQGREWER
jgi:hypothetical protein